MQATLHFMSAIESPWQIETRLVNSNTFEFRRGRRTFYPQPPDRRWSLDEEALKDLVGSKKSKKPRVDRLAPVYPILKEEERTRIATIPGIVVPKFDWNPGRWLYLTKENNLHVFHDFLLNRRTSLSDLESRQRSAAPKPHSARP